MKRSNRRDFLKICGAGLAGSVLPSCRASSRAVSRPNVLWIISEDTSPDLSCYGAPVVETPNLDSLAAEGIRFTRAYAAAPVCSPARSALMTGMYQTSIGAHQHRTRNKQPLPLPVEVITQYFRRAGYFVSNSGPDPGSPGKTDWNFEPGVDPFDGTDWSQRERGQPFFAQINLRLTHRVFEKDPENPINPGSVELPSYYPDHPLIRRDWADYLESLQVLDRRVGRILDRLREEGLAENSIVFYFGDHGRPHLWDKQWLYEGGIRIPLIVRWPGRFEPGRVSHDLVGAVDFAPTVLSLIGIEPPDHLQGQIFLGKRKAEREFIYAARDRCDETVDRIRCVRSKRYKYIRNYFPDKPYTQFNAYKSQQYPALQLVEVLHKRGELTPAQARFMAPAKPAEELYDLERDPEEIRDLAGRPEAGAELQRMRRALDVWIEDMKDQGEMPEDPAEVAHWREVMADRHAEWMKAKGLSLEATAEEHLEYWMKRMLEEGKT